MTHPIVHHVRKHLRKHKKHYVRFVAFFFMLVLFAYIEDLIVAFFTGVELERTLLVLIFVVAVLFTLIAQQTEKFFEKEAEKVAEEVDKEEKSIKRQIRGRELEK